MPNYASNEFRFGNGKDFRTFIKYAVNEKKQVDFNILLPMPEDLNIVKGPDSYDNFIYGKVRDMPVLETACQSCYNADIDQKSFIAKVKTELGEKLSLLEGQFNNIDTPIAGYFNIQRYGEQDWYDWRERYWNTKWNATDTVIEEDVAVYFDTAWSVPDHWIKLIAQKTDFDHIFTIEDNPEIYTCRYRSGKLVETVIDYQDDEEEEEDEE